VIATSLVNDFDAMPGWGMGTEAKKGKKERYMCGTAPLKEIPFTLADLASTDDGVIPAFKWTEAPETENYDFFGTLEMCGGVGAKLEWPDYLISQQPKNEIFGYRQFSDTSDSSSCGDEMAPLLRLQPGKKYKLEFINNSGSDTNLHAHGLHISGNGLADDITRIIPAGMCGIYMWDIPEDHMSGMHWYRPNAYQWSFEQVRGRAFGPIFIDEPADRKATYPLSIQKWLDNEVLIQMSSETAPSPAMFGDGVKDGRCLGGFDECYPRANNKKLETITMTKDEWYSVHLHAVIPNGTGKDVFKFYNENGLGNAPCEILIAGYDGVYRSKIPRPMDSYPEEAGLFRANGAGRLHVAMKCSANASLKLAKLESSVSHYGLNDLDEVSLVPIIVEFEVVEGDVTEASPYADEASLTQWEPPRPKYLSDLTAWDDEVESWDIRLELVGKGSLIKLQPALNGEVYQSDTPNIVASFDAVQEWSIYGTDSKPSGHPLHMQVNHMQILGSSGTVGTDCAPNLEFGEWYDTINVASADLDPWIVRFQFNDYAGKVIFHSHDLMMKDAGMMGWVQITGGPKADEAVTPVECANIL